MFWGYSDRGRPVPLFSFFRQEHDCRFSFSQGRKPRLSLLRRDNSVREPNAQPAPITGLFKGFGVLPQQAETAVSGNAGNCCFESLWEQRHCLPSSTAEFDTWQRHISDYLGRWTTAQEYAILNIPVDDNKHLEFWRK